MLIKNAYIFTFDNDDRVISNGYIKIEDKKIKKIGHMYELKAEDIVKAEEIFDAKGNLVFPGLICTHTHIYSAFARGMSLKGASTGNFIQILENLWWRLDKKLNHEDIYYSALVTLIDSIKNGVTCLFDHHAGPNSIAGSLDVLERAFKEVGVRGTLCYEVSDRDGLEKAKEGIEENVRFVKKSQKDSLVKGLFGLHASFTLSGRTLETAATEGKALGAGFHIHAAEGREDYEYNRRSFGRGVVERLEDYGIINYRSILAHCIHIKDEEVKSLKKANVVHNPESNMNNAVGYCDVLKLLKAKVLVGLGSDGFSSDPFRAMDCAYVLHKHEQENPAVMSPSEVITLAVKNNGRIASKFFDNPIGVIKEGSAADLITISYESPTPVNSDNIYGHIIFGMNGAMVKDSIINGKFVMKNRELVNIDEKEVFRKSREQAERLWERF